MTKLTNPVPLFLDGRGNPMDGGYIYVGVANSDPQIAPIAVFWDAAYTIPATQPLRTVGGLIVNGYTPSSVYFPQGDFALRVLDPSNALVFYSPSLFAAGSSYQGFDTDLQTISDQNNTTFGIGLLTLANAAALKAATGIVDCIPQTGGTVTGNITRSGAGAHFYGTDPAMTGAKIYPPLPMGSANPATGPGSLQGFY